MLLFQGYDTFEKSGGNHSVIPRHYGGTCHIRKIYDEQIDFDAILARFRTSIFAKQREAERRSKAVAPRPRNIVTDRVTPRNLLAIPSEQQQKLEL